jgi:hypothetical protein
MGEARARALQAWTQSSNNPNPYSDNGMVPPAGVLYRWRQAHPKGRGFSCYSRTVKIGIKDIAKLLQTRGQRMLDAAMGRQRGARKGARFQRKAGAE